MFGIALVINNRANNRMFGVHCCNDQGVTGPVVAIKIRDMNRIQLINKVLTPIDSGMCFWDLYKSPRGSCDKDNYERPEDHSTPIEGHLRPCTSLSQGTSRMIEGS